MGFRKLERSCRTPPGWRLATVEEAKDNLESIKHDLNLLEKWDRARLLDGWIGGSGYDFHVQMGFRSCLGYMLVVEPPTHEISVSEDEGSAGLYSKLHLNEEGRSAALFLCCEDWNYEVVSWLIMGEKEEGSASGTSPISLSEEIEEASELVSSVARKLQRVREKSRVPKTEFSCASMKALMSSIHDSVRDKNIDDILSLTELLDIGDQCWKEMGLTQDLKRFQDFEFDVAVTSTWEAIADTVWYVAADAMAVVIVRESCRFLREKVDHRQLEGQRMEDRAFVSSVVAYANELLDGIFFGYDSLWKIVKKAAESAKGDCKSFEKLSRDQGYGTCGNYGVLNTILVEAVKEGDVNMAERLIECGVQPSQTDDERKMTALHHAANLDDEAKGFVIAEMLLREKTKTLANAVDYEGRTALHLAAFCGHTRMCELLLRHGASVSCREITDCFPLHLALQRKQQNEETIRVLISADSSRVVDEVDGSRLTPIDYAIECQGTNVKMVTWLLSLSNQPEEYFEKLDLTAYLRESSRMGYMDLVKKLLEKVPDLLATDDEGKTALHYAAEGEKDDVALNIIKKLVGTDEKKVKNVELATACDKYGRNVLHVAAFLGHKALCRWLFSEAEGIDLDSPDRDGQSALYYAVAGAHDNDEVLDIFISKEQGMSQVYLKDLGQATPLHLAAERGNLKMMEKLLSKVISKQERNEYVRAADVLDQTALHKAARGGHKKIVRKLLDEGAHPLEERDCDGKTALHYAVQAENGEDAISIVQLLLKKCGSDEERILILFASAVGIGSAEQSLSSNSLLKKYLAESKRKILENLKDENLLGVAAKSGNIDMTREFLTRGANIASIRSHKWRDKLEAEENENVGKVLKQIDKIVEQGTDKPALWDNLGRSPFANGLAALFLNPFVKSPITVGISGEWGMGKSSLMFQTESILLKTAAQLAFSNSMQIEDFPGTSKCELSANGKARREKIEQSIKMLSTTKESENKSKEGDTDTLGEFLGNYQPKYHEVFKSLAVMDRRDMFKDEEESGSRNPSDGLFSGMPWEEEDSLQGTTPSILTVRYNAWQYRNESEAWAGLAVEITKELEATMTVAQKFWTSWRYNWETRKNSICFGVILPCFLAVFTAIWLTTIVWLLLDRAKSENIQDLKYGSLPATVIVAVWAVVRSVMSVVKPISSQIVDYICLPDHSGKLGYHRKVISDINFLKEKLGERPSWLWKMFAFIWCFITFSWDENCVPNTQIPKMPPASMDNLRIVVFVDDLDRCQENVILQILSAVNLVLAACEINVILGMDKSMIERAIIRMFGDKNTKPNQSSQDLADKYLRKIIQLPLDLPDPSNWESESFLQAQLGMQDAGKGTTESEAQTKIHNGYANRKVNRKFQMGTSIPKKSKPATGEPTKYPAETGGAPVKDLNFSDATGEGPIKKERKATNEESGLVGAETKILIPEATDIEHLNTRNEQDTGANDNKRRGKTEPPITSEMLFPKYSKGERNAFYFLQTHATRSRRLPREWKRFLYYHRLAWNILSKSPEVKTVTGWQVQLIAWVFVCWQWKHLITTLVKNWHDLEILKKWITVNEIRRGKVEVIEENSGPSLREIVEYYINEKWPADKMSGVFKGDSVKMNKEVPTQEVGVNTRSSSIDVLEATGSSLPNFNEEDTKSILENYFKEWVRKVLKEEREMKRRHLLKLKGLQGKRFKKGKRMQEEQDPEDDLTNEEAKKGESSEIQQGTGTKKKQKAFQKDRNKGKRKVNMDEEEEREEWKKLKEALSRYNVSMDGIQAFQKFRFYCIPGHLPWPLPKRG